MADKEPTPISQVPFANARTSLVGIPTRLIDPLAEGARAQILVETKEQKIRDINLEEDFRVARKEMELAGDGILTTAREAALESTDYTKVRDVYVSTVGDQLETLKSGITNTRDLATFNLQMEDRMLADDVAIGRHTVDLRRDHELSLGLESIASYKKLVASGILTDLDLAKSRTLTTLADMVATGARSQTQAILMEAELFGDFEVTHIAAVANNQANPNRYDDALVALREQNPETGEFELGSIPQDTRLRMEEVLKDRRSTQNLNEILVSIDDGKSSFNGLPMRFAIDELHDDDDRLSDDHWRMAITAHNSRIERELKTVDLLAIYERGLAGYWDYDDPNTGRAQDFGWNRYRPDIEDPEIRLAMFMREAKVVPPSVLSGILGAAGDARSEDSDERLMDLVRNLGLYRQVKIFAAVDLERKVRNKPMGKAQVIFENTNARLYGTARTDSNASLVWPSVENILDGQYSINDPQHTVAIAKMEPIQAVRSALNDYERQLGGNPKLSDISRKEQLHVRQVLGPDGSGLREDLIDTYLGKLRDQTGISASPKHINDEMVEALAGRYAVGRANLLDERSGIDAAAQGTLGSGLMVSPFNTGKMEVVKHPIEAYAKPVIDPVTGDNYGHWPYKAEVIIQTALNNLERLRSEDPENATPLERNIASALERTIKKVITDERFLTGASAVVADSRALVRHDPFGDAAVHRIYDGTGTTNKHLVDLFARELDVQPGTAWEIYNAMQFPGISSQVGKREWEPGIYGDDLTFGAKNPEGEFVSASYLLFANFEDGDFYLATDEQFPLGRRVQMLPTRGKKYANRILQELVMRDGSAVDPALVEEKNRAILEHRKKINAALREGTTLEGLQGALTLGP